MLILIFSRMGNDLSDTHPHGDGVGGKRVGVASDYTHRLRPDPVPPHLGLSAGLKSPPQNSWLAFPPALELCVSCAASSHPLHPPLICLGLL